MSNKPRIEWSWWPCAKQCLRSSSTTDTRSILTTTTNNYPRTCTVHTHTHTHTLCPPQTPPAKSLAKPQPPVPSADTHHTHTAQTGEEKSGVGPSKFHLISRLQAPYSTVMVWGWFHLIDGSCSTLQLAGFYVGNDQHAPWPVQCHFLLWWPAREVVWSQGACPPPATACAHTHQLLLTGRGSNFGISSRIHHRPSNQWHQGLRGEYWTAL